MSAPGAPDELDIIAAEAAAFESDAAAALPGTEPAPAPVDPVQEWRDAARMAGGLVTALYPELKPDWTDTNLDNFGGALAACADHYGWTLGDILGHPLLGLAVASWPLGVPLVRVAKARAKKPGAIARPAPMSAAESGGPVTARPAVMMDFESRN